MDRITQSISDVVTNEGGWCRHRTFVSATEGNGASNLISPTLTSVDGLETRTIAFGMTNRTVTVYSTNGVRSVYRYAPDGSVESDSFVNGRLASSRRLNSGYQVIAGRDFSYDPHGRLSGVTDLRNGTTTNSFDGADRVLTVTSPSPALGQPSQTVTNVYDVLGRLVAVRSPDGGVVTNEYYPTGLLRKTSGARTYPVEYKYDAQGRMKEMITWRDFAGSTGAATNTWNYSTNRGWLESKRYPDGNGPDYSYTAGGRLKTRSWARSGPSGRITATFKYGFDDGISTNQYGDVVEVSYNDSATPTVTTSYDRMGRVRSLVAGTNTLSRFWSAEGLALGEAWTGGILSGRNVTNTYDALFRRSSLTARSGSTSLGSPLGYAYDSAGRLASVGDGMYSATYAYLSNSPLWETVSFRQNGALRSVTTRDFDALNRLKSITTTAGGSTPFSFAYGYNAANQRTNRVEAGGSYWVYQYDSLGQVVSGKKFWADGNPVAGQQFEYGYDDIGNRKSAKEGGNASGTGLRSIGYTANALNQYTARTNASAVDVLGIATASAAVTINGAAAYRKNEYFRGELNVTNVLASVVTPVSVLATSGSSSNVSSGKILSPRVAQGFGYDLDGNLTNDVVWAYAWDGENRLLSVENTTNVVAAERRRVAWDYDAAGRRIRQTTYGWNGGSWTNGTQLLFLYDGWACVAELDAAGALTRQYAWGLDLSKTTTGAGGVGGLLWMRPSGGAAHFAAFDGNGNVAGLVDASTGAVSASYDYDPYGGTIRLTGVGSTAQDNPFRFSTKRYDPTTGLVLYEYRPYSPSLGRWPNRDPLEEAGAALLSRRKHNNGAERNEYTFVRNSAIGSIDALGLDGQPVPPVGPSAPVNLPTGSPDPELEAAKKWLTKCMPRLCRSPLGVDYPIISSPWVPGAFGIALIPGVIILDRPALKRTEDLVTTIAHECAHKWRGTRGSCLGPLSALVNQLYSQAIADEFTGMHNWLGDEFEDAILKAYRKDPNGDRCSGK